MHKERKRALTIAKSGAEADRQKRWYKRETREGFEGRTARASELTWLSRRMSGQKLVIREAILQRHKARELVGSDDLVCSHRLWRTLSPAVTCRDEQKHPNSARPSVPGDPDSHFQKSTHLDLSIFWRGLPYGHLAAVATDHIGFPFATTHVLQAPEVARGMLPFDGRRPSCQRRRQCAVLAVLSSVAAQQRSTLFLIFL